MDRLGAGEQGADLFPHLQPLFKAGRRQQAAHQGALARHHLGDSRTAGAAHPDQAGQPPHQQSGDGAERSVVLGPRHLVAEGMQRGHVELGQGLQQVQQLAVQLQAALVGERQRLADAALAQPGQGVNLG
jgi:hypothetical protein